MDWIIRIGIGLGVLLAIGIPLHFCQKVSRKRNIEAAFAGRDPLYEKGFYERYFQSKGVPAEIVIKVRQILEQELGADMSRLNAADDFSRNLKFFWDYDSMANVEIVVRLEEEFGIKISDAEAERTRTVSDIVNLVAEKVQQEGV